MRILAALTIAILALSGCSSEGQDAADKKAVNTQQKQYAVGQPIPHFDWSLERDLTVQLYQARNRNVATYSVWRSDLGQINGHCPSIGFPLPYDTSLTNPLKAVRLSQSGVTAIEQAEPNGIYASKNSNATWVMCAIQTADGRVKAPIYIEDKVTVYPFPVTVDYTNNRVTMADGAKPTVILKER